MDLVDNLRSVRERIGAACERAGRQPSSVTLVAVGKAHGADAIETLYDAGHRDFGESYVQEWQDKADRLPDDVRWHFVGHLQSNKAKYLVDRVHLIHSVDRTSVMKKLNRRSQEKVNVLLQVNVGDDPAKSGVSTEDALDLLKKSSRFESLEICGLMTVPPIEDDVEKTRAHFARLRRTFETLQGWLEEHEPARLEAFEHLSMGMTADFEVAVEEGATLVRVGTAIFGERSYT